MFAVFIVLLSLFTNVQAYQGKLIIISGPSGVGKGTVCKRLLENTPNLVQSISATTRTPRQGEVDGINYFFKSVDEFLSMQKNDQLLEWTKYSGNYYGTPKAFVENQRLQGNDVLLEVDVTSALRIKEKSPDSLLIFLAPPNLEELEARLRKRGTESDEEIRRRLKIAEEELAQANKYDYVVINTNVDKACQEIKQLIH